MHSSQLDPIGPENWQEAATALCHAAKFYELLSVEAIRLLLREGYRDEVESVLGPLGEEIDRFQAVTQHWRRFLDIRDRFD